MDQGSPAPPRKSTREAVAEGFFEYLATILWVIVLGWLAVKFLLLPLFAL